MAFNWNAGGWSKVPGSAASSVGRTANAFSAFTQTRMHARGMREISNMYGLSRGMGKLGRAFGLGYLAYEVYTGYQEGGVLGAAGNVAEGAAFSYGIGALLGSGAVAATAVLGLGAAAAGGMVAGQMFARETGRMNMVQSREIEMGSGHVPDPFGYGATMRRRSISALQNSRINATSALGNEAALSYTPYFR